MNKRRLPPLNSLRAFESAARNQSLTRAADELCVTHSAISRHVMKLEEYLGAQLFERKHQQVVLTRRGAAYAERLQGLLDGIEEATEACFHTRRGEQVLRIGTLSTFAMRFLIPRLARFRSQHPGVSVELESSHHNVDPAQAGVQVAIWLGTGGWPEYACEELFAEELMPVASRALLEGHPLESPDDIAPFLLLHSEGRLDDWGIWLRAMGATKVSGRKGLRLQYSSLVYQGAIDSLGLAMAQTLMVHEDLAQGRLVPVMAAPVRSGRSYYLVRERQDVDKPLISAFAAWLSEEIAAAAKAFDERAWATSCRT